MASIGDRVYLDRNNNGTEDTNEKGVARAIVMLSLPDGSTRQTATDGNGNYRFADLSAGTFAVEVLSSTNPTNGPKKRTLNLVAGQANLEQDFGFNAAGVQGIQTERVDDGTAQQEIAFTGANSLLVLAVGFILLGGGGRIVLRNRRRPD